MLLFSMTHNQPPTTVASATELQGTGRLPARDFDRGVAVSSERASHSKDPVAAMMSRRQAGVRDRAYPANCNLQAAPPHGCWRQREQVGR